MFYKKQLQEWVKMESLKLIEEVDTIEYREHLYYKKYRYKAAFRLDGIYYTWLAKEDKNFGDAYIYWHNNKSLHFRHEKHTQVMQNIPILNQFVDWRRKHEDLITVRIEGNYASVFSNDLPLLKSLNFIDNLHVSYAKAEYPIISGVKTFKNEPPYNYRIYLKSKIIESSVIEHFKETLKNNSNLHPCKSLLKWLRRPQKTNFRYTSAHHFVDYDDENVISYLSLLHGELLGKKFKLEKRPS